MARKDDYVPVNDLDMSEWIGLFADYVAAHGVEYGLTPQQIASLPAAREEFDEALEDYRRALLLQRSACARKKSARSALEEALRPIARQMNHHSGMTADVRAMLGLKEPQPHRVRMEVGDEAPLLHVEARKTSVTVHFGSDPANEQRNGRPKWSAGCAIYRRRYGEAQYQLVGYATQSPFRDQVPQALTEYSYVARYVGRRDGEMGRPSAEASVAAGVRPELRAA